MLNYQLPKFEMPKLKKPKNGFSGSQKQSLVHILVIVVLLSSLSGFLGGLISGNYFYGEIRRIISNLQEQNQIILPTQDSGNQYQPVTSQEQAIVKVVKDVSPAVVNIIVSKEQPVYEQYYQPFFEEFLGEPFYEFMVPQYRQKGVEKRQVGGGTGFIISKEGMVLTNKHVLLDEEAEYSVLTVDNEELAAEVLARDPFQDIAVLKIVQSDSERTFPTLKMGDSDNIEIGQTVIAIGYVLGRYQNTVSVGVVSGLGRTITASGGDFYETLEDIIQTDAAINKGNSGGPLLNLKGEVIGMNTAIDVEGQNIGFAIPINKAKRDIEQVRERGDIIYPFLGIRYILIEEGLQKENNLPVDYGAWIIKGPEGETAIFPGSAADEAGLREGDIVLEFEGERITTDNSLADIIIQYQPGDKVSLKVLREEEMVIEVILGER